MINLKTQQQYRSHQQQRKQNHHRTHTLAPSRNLYEYLFIVSANSIYIWHKKICPNHTILFSKNRDTDSAELTENLLSAHCAINAFSPYLPQRGPLSELNNIDSPYQERRPGTALTQNSTHRCNIHATCRPLNKNMVSTSFARIKPFEREGERERMKEATKNGMERMRI